MTKRRDPTRWGIVQYRFFKGYGGVYVTKGCGKVRRKNRPPAWKRGERKFEAVARLERRHIREVMN